MSYAKQTWGSGAAGGTPITATRLNAMEQGIYNAEHVTCTSTTRPTTGLFDGMMIWETDTKAIGVYDLANTTWHMFDTMPQSYTPVFTTATGTPSVGNGSLIGHYFRRGRSIDLRVSFFWGSTSNGGLGSWTFTAPFAAVNTSSNEQSFFCKCWCAAGVYTGSAFISAGTTTINPALPNSLSNCAQSSVRNADSSGAVGTGIPLASGAFTFNTTGHNLVMAGTYEAAAG